MVELQDTLAQGYFINESRVLELIILFKVQM